MQTRKYRVKLTFTADLLGTTPLDVDVLTNHIRGREGEGIPDDELETAPESNEKGMTGFHALPDGTPILYDYMIKGFFKDACSMLRRVKGSVSSSLRAHKKVIDGLVFVRPRQIRLQLPSGAEMGTMTRPLRAQTAQGERVALACSQTLPAGTVLEFELTVLGKLLASGSKDRTDELLEEWFAYGALRGLGQWRNAGWGTFTYELEEVL